MVQPIYTLHTGIHAQDVVDSQRTIATLVGNLVTDVGFNTSLKTRELILEKLAALEVYASGQGTQLADGTTFDAAALQTFRNTTFGQDADPRLTTLTGVLTSVELQANVHKTRALQAAEANGVIDQGEYDGLVQLIETAKGQAISILEGIVGTEGLSADYATTARSAIDAHADAALKEVRVERARLEYVGLGNEANATIERTRAGIEAAGTDFEKAVGLQETAILGLKDIQSRMAGHRFDELRQTLDSEGSKPVTQLLGRVHSLEVGVGVSRGQTLLSVAQAIHGESYERAEALVERIIATQPANFGEYLLYNANLTEGAIAFVDTTLRGRRDEVSAAMKAERQPGIDLTKARSGTFATHAAHAERIVESMAKALPVTDDAQSAALSLEGAQPEDRGTLEAGTFSFGDKFRAAQAQAQDNVTAWKATSGELAERARVDQEALDADADRVNGPSVQAALSDLVTRIKTAGTPRNGGGGPSGPQGGGPVGPDGSPTQAVDAAIAALADAAEGTGDGFVGDADHRDADDSSVGDLDGVDHSAAPAPQAAPAPRARGGRFLGGLFGGKGSATSSPAIH